MTKIADPLHTLALSVSIEILRGTLGEAIDYLTHDNYTAALGTLILFDEQADDIKAALRLFTKAMRRSK